MITNTISIVYAITHVFLNTKSSTVVFCIMRHTANRVPLKTKQTVIMRHTANRIPLKTKQTIIMMRIDRKTTEPTARPMIPVESRSPVFSKNKINVISKSQIGKKYVLCYSL